MDIRSSTTPNAQCSSSADKRNINEISRPPTRGPGSPAPPTTLLPANRCRATPTRQHRSMRAKRPPAHSGAKPHRMRSRSRTRMPTSNQCRPKPALDWDAHQRVFVADDRDRTMRIPLTWSPPAQAVRHLWILAPANRPTLVREETS